MKITRLIMALIPAAFLGAASMVQAQTPGVASWEGFYGGLNVGAARNATCNTWTADVTEETTFEVFSSRNCPTDTAFVGGVQIGYNFQFDRVVLGIGLDYDYWHSKTRTSSFNYNGDEPPPDGTYGFSGKVSPNSFAILGPSLGYAIDNWLPYFRVGAVYAGGSHSSTASYTADGVTASAAGGKYYKSSGFGAGIGVDYLVADHWFVSAEYTYINLGKASGTNPSCYSSNEEACIAFSNVTLNNSPNTFTANLLRVGLNYKFGGAPQQAAPPPPPPPPPPPKPAPLCPNVPAGVTVDRFGCPCDVTQEVHFATNSSVLTDQDKVLLDKVVAMLKQLNLEDGEVWGYTDSTGTAAYNVGLSQRRARAVADYLEAQGIASGRLKEKGFGEDNPVGDNKTREGRAHNRRVVVHRNDCSK